MKSQCFWYVEPKDSKSNEIIAKALEEKQEESRFRGIICADGRRRNLWQCSYDFASYLWRSRQNLGARFEIYSQNAGGKIKKCTFLFQKPKKYKRKTSPSPK